MACIGIAFLFWLLNKLTHTFRTTQWVKLEYRLPPGKAFRYAPSDAVRATIQAQGWDMIRYRQLKVPINVASDSFQVIPEGRIREIVADQLGLNTESVHLDFNDLKLTVEDEAEKTVPIAVAAQLSFRSGYELSQQIYTNPLTVKVTGPKSVLDTLQSIPTDTLRMKALREGTSAKIKLAAPPLLHLGVDVAEAILKVEQFTEKSLFIPVVVKNAPTAIKIFPNKIKITCTMALSQYSKINVSAFQAEVDFAGVSSDPTNNTLPINMVKSPENVRGIHFSPKSVEYFFEK